MDTSPSGCNSVDSSQEIADVAPVSVGVVEMDTVEITVDPEAQAEDNSERRPPLIVSTPNDTDALPAGRVKLFGFLLGFSIWVGGWGLIDDLIWIVAGTDNLIALALYLSICFVGWIGLKMLARRYRGYAMLDEIRSIN